jgi:pyruvate dehydrogenase E2 component (dihydrolipoamide acetyltransferase)
MMAIEILVPRLGWTMEEGTFVEWLKHDGDTVQQGDLLYRLEGDKALTEVEALDDGILRIPPDSPAPGSVVPVGALLAYVVALGEAAPFEQGGGPEYRAWGAGESGSSGAAEPVGAGSTSAQPQTESVGAGFMPAQTPAQSEEGHKKGPAISPRALRVANELGVDWAKVTGSGRSGRIVEEDIRRAAEAQAPAKPVAPPQPVSPATSSTAARAPLSRTRRIIAERMSAGVHVAAPVTLNTEVDATELVRLREQLKVDRKGQVIPSYSDLLTKIIARALADHPALNARIEGDEVVTESAVHVGIAVDTEHGLLVPVLHDAQSKTLLQIAAESAALIARTREGKASLDDLGGSTFTITNLGMYDIDTFSPIINLPECAILGVGRITAKQVVTLRPGSIDEAERVAVRRMLTLSLTFDHRLVDGAPAARFLQRVKQLVEQPYLWLVS